MKITEVRAIPLFGKTPETGWSREPGADENLHTLIAVETDEGITGVGSSFTSGGLVEGAIELLRPNLIGESAIEPERLSEKLSQMPL